METIPSVWHLWIMWMIYFAMCSTMVRTLPCPIGAFGPRNPEFIVSFENSKIGLSLILTY